MDIFEEGLTPIPGGMTGYGMTEEEIRKQRELMEESVKKKEEEEAAKATEAAQTSTPPPSPLQEVGTAIVGGVGDFIQDVDEKVPFLDIPDNWSPQNQTGWGKALRGFTSVVLPTVGLMLVTRGAAKKMVGAERLATMPKTAKYFGEFAADAAAGVAVDAISRESEGENLARLLKDNLPEQFSWLPDDITTLDTDSPDVKRQKNIIEGAGFGALIDGIGWAVKGLRALSGANPATKYIPKDEAAKKFQEGLDGKQADETDLEDTLSKAEDAREEVKFRRGIRDLEDDPEGLMPTPDVNTPLYEPYEQAVIARPRDAARQNDVDAARIAQNIDTANGRMTPVMDSADYREANLTDATGMEARKRLVEEQKIAGVYNVETMNGRSITYRMILDARDEDLKTIFKNLDDNSFTSIKKELESMKTDWLAGVKSGRLDAVGLPRAAKMARTLIEVMDPDNLRASGRLQRTTAGQIADNATAIRQMYDQGLDTTRQEQLQLEMLEFLASEIKFASYTNGRGLQLMKLLKKETTPETMKQIEQEVQDALLKSKQDAKTFSQTLGKLREEDPTNFKALMDAYEATDGKVDTIEALNRWGEQTLSIRAAAFKSPDEAKSIFAKGLWSTFYNSVLSATATPLRAATGNYINGMLKNTSYALGARMDGFWGGGNKYHMKRAAIAAGAELESFRQGWDHLLKVWGKTRVDPDSVKYAAREEIVEQDKMAIRAAESYALAQAEKGNYAPLWKFRFSKWMIDINNKVGLRYSTNAMTSLDAFSRAYLANGEAYKRALDDLFTKNPNRVEFSPEEIAEAASKARAKMFGPDGYLTDEMVEQQARQLTLNLDNDATQRLNGILEMVPILRTLITFPRTSLNALNFAINSSSLGRSVFIPWTTDVKRILKADKDMDLTLAKEIMESKGMAFSKTQWDAMVIETKGRLAIGDSVVAMAIFGATMGTLTGNGPATEKERRAWQKVANWQPRSFKFGDVYVSYDAFEPFGTYLALIADMVQLGTRGTSAPLEEMFDKASMIISMSIGDKTMLNGFRPLIEALNGNEYAFQQWAGTTANSMMPLGGLRNQIGQLMNPGLRELEGQFGEFVRNRNSFMDTLDPAGALPPAYDPFDGSKVRDINPFQRMANYLTPFRFNMGTEPHRQWLMEIGFDAVPELRASSLGTDYSPQEASMLAKIMGEQGILDKRIRELYKNKSLQREENFYRRQRLNGVAKEDLPNEKVTFRLIRQAFSDAKRSAEAAMYAMPEFQIQRQQGLRARQLKAAQKTGDTQAIQQILSMPK